MLRPHECFAASLGHAQPMSFILPSEGFGHPGLVVRAEERKFAVFVDGPDDFRFHFMECEDRWAALHIPGVAIELDPASVVHTNGQWPPLGSLTRHGESLSIQTRRLDSHMSRFSTAMTIMAGLPSVGPQQKACFQRWRIVLGEGRDKRVLKEIEAKFTAQS